MRRFQAHFAVTTLPLPPPRRLGRATKRIAELGVVAISYSGDSSSTLMAIGSLAGNVCFSASSSRSFICAIAAEDFCGFFGAIMTSKPFPPSSALYWMFASATKGGRPLNVKRGPNCAFMTEIAYIKEGGLGSEPLGGGVEAAATRKRWGLRRPYQSGHARVVWLTVLVANVSPRAQTKHCRRPHAPPYHGRFALAASGRCSKGSYVPSQSEDIDLK